MPTIIITEEQLRHIEEMTFEKGIDTPNETPEYTQSKISVSGKLNDEDFANPVTTDNYANSMAKSFPWGVGTCYRGFSVPIIRETNELTDINNDNVPDQFNHADANELNDGDESDDQQIIPHSIEVHLDRLINAMKTSNLTPKKQMNIVNKLIDKMEIKGLPPSYKRETSMKILNKK